MASGSKEIVYRIVGDASQMDKAFKQASTSGEKFSSTVKGGVTPSLGDLAKKGLEVGAVFFGAQGLIEGMKGIVDAGMQAQKTQAALDAQLVASHQSLKQYGSTIDDTIGKQSGLSGYTRDQLTQSFITLDRATGDVNHALRDNALAMDIARGRNMDLQTASLLVAKAAEGNATALKRMGIEVQKGSTATQILQMLQEKFAGQAEAFGNTAAGAQARFSASLEAVKEKLGQAVLPAITAVASKAASFLSSPEVQHGINVFGTFMSDKVSPILKRVGELLGTVFQKAWPVVKKVAESIFSVVSTVLHSLEAVYEKHKQQFAAAFAAIGAAVKFVATDVIEPVYRFLYGTIIPKLIDVAITAIDKVITAIKDVVVTFKNVWENAGRIMNDFWHWMERTAISAVLKLIEPFSHIPRWLGGGWAQDMKKSLGSTLTALAQESASAGFQAGKGFGENFQQQVAAYGSAAYGSLAAALSGRGATAVAVAAPAADTFSATPLPTVSDLGGLVGNSAAGGGSSSKSAAHAKTAAAHAKTAAAHAAAAARKAAVKQEMDYYKAMQADEAKSAKQYAADQVALSKAAAHAEAAAQKAAQKDLTAIYKAGFDERTKLGIQAAQQDVTSAEQALTRVKATLSTATSGFKTAWSRLAQAGVTEFDQQTQDGLRKMQRDAQAQLDAFDTATQQGLDAIRSKYAAPTASEAAAKQLQDAHDAAAAAKQLASDQQALSTAQAGGNTATISAAQDRVNEDLYQQQLKALQDKAQLERTAANQQQTLDEQAYNDQRKTQRQALDQKLQDDQTAHQRQRDAQKVALDQQAQDLEAALAARTTSTAKANADILALYKQNGLDVTAELGKVTAALASMNTARAAVATAQAGVDQAKAAAAAVKASPATAGVQGAYEQVKRALGGLDLPAFAAGGLVTKPTIALVGEAGPELITPVSKLNPSRGAGPSVVIQVSGNTMLTRDIDVARQIARAIAPHLNRISQVSS